MATRRRVELHAGPVLQRGVNARPVGEREFHAGPVLLRGVNARHVGESLVSAVRHFWPQVILLIMAILTTNDFIVVLVRNTK